MFEIDPLRLFPFLPDIVNLAMSINFYVIIMMISYLIVKKVRMIGAIRTLVLWKDGTHSIKNYKIKEGRLQIRKRGILTRRDKGWMPTVESANIIPAKRTLGTIIKPIGFKQKDILIAVEDAPECVTIKGAKTLDIESINKAITSILIKSWSRDEIREFIKKALAQATVQRKIFSDQQFYMFFAVLLANLLVSIMIANRIGVF